MLQSTFKESLNLLSQQTVPDAQVIAREREEEAAFSFKVKTTDISEHFGFNMIILKSLPTHSVFYQKRNKRLSLICQKVSSNLVHNCLGVVKF